ncbi:putative mutator protein MutT4 [Nocardia cerradoensis]|uniref:Putative mutator protein MutT4 n=1 Tax=Nocardia cerradoensis TaxID=85688 RepID=A0A231HDU4_9NOCA|nr:NUDIX domain-containing protein [Nocardia cerradoensis]OXR47101.1 putative mutator protein MutT4 [Nocardia cerradoensis]
MASKPVSELHRAIEIFGRRGRKLSAARLEEIDAILVALLPDYRELDIEGKQRFALLVVAEIRSAIEQFNDSVDRRIADAVLAVSSEFHDKTVTARRQFVLENDCGFSEDQFKNRRRRIIRDIAQYLEAAMRDRDSHAHASIAESLDSEEPSQSADQKIEPIDNSSVTISVSGDYLGNINIHQTSLDAISLPVAVGIVVDGPPARADKVLLVRRRERYGALDWQFPAGIVKPGEIPAELIVHEVAAETGVHCSVVDLLGQRVHPITNVRIIYFLCRYISGIADNLDPNENRDVIWCEVASIGRYIPIENIYLPAYQRLQLMAARDVM